MERFFYLTEAVYRVTKAFPKEEPLKNKIRETALNVFAGLILTRKNPAKLKNGAENEISQKILKDIEILENFFSLAEKQDWVSPLNFSILGKEYSKIKEELKSKNPQEQTLIIPFQTQPQLQPRYSATFAEVNQNKNANNSVNPRHQKIIEVLRAKGKAQVWELKEIFPELSKRTLRRDFEYLLNQGIVERVGEKNETFYKLR